MAVTAFMYGHALMKALTKEIDWSADTIKVALVTSSYTPNQDTDDYWDDVAANEASGTGYTAGGATLASKVFTYTNGTNTIDLSAADTTWASSTVTARYAVIYDATPSTNATRPLLGYVDFGADQSSSNGSFTISWNASGIFNVLVS